MIPQPMRNHASIEKDVRIMGVGKRIEIWSLDNWTDLKTAMAWILKSCPTTWLHLEYNKYQIGDNMEFKHVSVLLDECINALDIKPGGIYVDGTMGGGGHTEEILKGVTGSGVVVGIDQDMDAIMSTSKKLSKYGDKLKVCHGNFSQIKELLSDIGITQIDGVLLDLGVSSYQLDTPDRGFSYMNDGPLDMRMDKSSSKSAFTVVNEYDENDLTRIIRDFGEERYARRIAKAIVRARSDKNLETTHELVSVIRGAIPGGGQREAQHPAKRTFQAIRIEVNGELEIIENTIRDISSILNENGRIAIITFHSLEDRIVKNTFRDLATGCKCPKEFPICVCNNMPTLKVISRKAIDPSEEEVRVNPRSRSAKLRVAEKL
jgi:16S rRNA (cytosine1402-N4)-methyltransferase